MTTQSKTSQRSFGVQADFVATARSILSGTIGIVEGSRRLTDLGQALGAERDPDFTFFVGVDSETDHFPLGEVRRHWAADALRRKDEELRECEEFLRAKAFRACQSLIQQYDKPMA